MLDWGVGGLGCYTLLKARLPDLPVLYCSDTGAVPYGKLPRAALRARVEQLLRALLAQGATQLVVACNAASTVLPGLALGVPSCGVIEHGLRAVPGTLRGTLAVIGGGRTVRSGLYQRGLGRPGLRVVGRIAQPLSGHIEAGTTHQSRFRDDLRTIMAPLRDVDALLLACTHYPAIAPALREWAPRALLIDPVETLVETIVRDWSLPRSAHVADRFLTTGDPEAMRSAAARVFGVQVARCERLAL